MTYSLRMEKEERALRHELKNAEQDKLALKNMVTRAADEIDELADAECSDDAIAKAKSHADRLRKIGETRSD